MDLYKKNEPIGIKEFLNIPSGILGNRELNLDSSAILVYSLLMQKGTASMDNSSTLTAEFEIHEIQKELCMDKQMVLKSLQILENAGLLRKISA